MKKGTLHFLGRKNPSLFDSNIKIKDMDNVELVLDASNIPESGTAKVRSRPTVKHYTSSSDIVQGFAVATPKVPILPPILPFNGPKLNGAVNGDRMSNGSAISVPDLVGGGIFIPPPPSMAPPPPPPLKFVPPPDYHGDLAALQPPAMAPPKPPSVAPSEEDEDLTFLKPPPMAPPKPPSTSSSASTCSLPISTPPPFAPPQPPHKGLKSPPPKPTRMSSIPSMDGPPQAPAPSPPVQTPTPSSFNPQNTAKLYHVPKTTILGVQLDREKRPKQILLLQDSMSTDSVPVPVQVNGKVPSEGPPVKPARRNSSGIQLEKDLQDLKENLQATLPGRPSKSQTQMEVKVEPPSLPTPKDITPAPTPPIDSPKLQKVSTATISSEARTYSPLLERKLHHLKSGEAKEGAVTSPLALLMAAKQRDKHRSNTLSRENSSSTKKVSEKSEPSTASIQPSESRPNSFTVIPRSTSSSSITSQDRPNSVVPVEPIVRIPTPGPPQTPGPPRSTALVGEKPPPTNPVQDLLLTSRSSSSSLAVESAEHGPSPSDCVRDEENGEELCMQLLPPPPEFANFEDDSVESPPSSPPPDPPQKKVLPPTPSPILQVKAPSPILQVKAPTPTPPPKPKPQPPSPPKLPPPDMEVKPKLPVQTKPKVPPSQAPTSLSASQATLLSILQKKMLEMDHKVVPMKETESSSDDWGSPLSDEEVKSPVVPRAVPKSKPLPTLPVQTPSLDMRELENKVAKKAQDLSSKATPSNGTQSKQPFGMTFQVRPGTKQPITVVNKGDP